MTFVPERRPQLLLVRGAVLGALVSLSVLTAARPVGAEPDGTRTETETTTETTDTERDTVSGLPSVVGELLELRLDAQEAITEAELARVDAERARARARSAHFDATVARLRARHAQDVLDRWASALYRNEIGVSSAVAVAETGILDPARVLDVAVWLDLAGRDRAQDIADARRLLTKVESLERLAVESLERAEEAEQQAELRRAEADVILASTETALREAVGDDFKHQLTVGPDGCPVSAPEGTVRYGDSEQIAALCARSVALAPTPEAALAIKYAFRALGAAYACDGIGRELPMRYDCSSLVARAYSEGAGLLTATESWIPTTRNLLPWDGMPQAPWSRTIDPADALPGDLVLYDTSHLESRHVVMILADGYMLHTAECGDVSHVTRLWGFADGDGYRYLGTRRVDPALARDPGLLDVGEGLWLSDGVHETRDALDPDAILPFPSADGATTAGAIEESGAGLTTDTSRYPQRTGPETSIGGVDHEAGRQMRRYLDRNGVR